MNIMQIMPSGGNGGAEVLFSRLASGLSKKAIQQILVKRNHSSYPTPTLPSSRWASLPFINQYDLYTRFKLKKLIEREQPKIVLSWLRRANQLIKGKKSTNTIYIGRLDGYYKVKHFVHNDFLIANTPDIQSHIMAYGYPKDRTIVIPNFTTSPLLDFEVTPARPQNKILLVAWGRLIKMKGFDNLIRVLAKSKRYHLWLLGEGEEKEKLQTLAESLNAQDQITWLGWKENISPYLFAADILVVPSLHESFGNVIIEAWAHKKPLIASNSQGPSWLVSHEKSGLLFEKGCIDSLFKCISQLANCLQLQQSIAERGHYRYLEQFTEEKILSQYINFFNSVLS